MNYELRTRLLWMALALLFGGIAAMACYTWEHSKQTRDCVERNSPKPKDAP